MKDAKLERYCRMGHRQVAGWLSPVAIDVIRLIADVQHTVQLDGAVCEIGVHHGRLFILLCLLRRRGERALAYDLFGRQEENSDRSGAGDEAILQANLARHGVDRTGVAIVQANSLALTARRIIDDCGARVRLFSVDGGHTAEVTANDLELAAGALAEGGIALLDDFFNEAWPGVAEGACRYMAGATCRLHPVAIAGNKFAFTTAEPWAARYQQAIMNSALRAEYKWSVVFGMPVVIRLPELSAKRRAASFAARRFFGARLRGLFSD